jgi:hypothetical protein
MVRTAIQGRAARFVALLLLALTFSPFDKSDDYLYLFLQGQWMGGSVSASSCGPEISETITENGLDSCHHCSCLICSTTIAVIIPRLSLLPMAPEEPRMFSAIRAKFPFYCEIFHPPRA